MRLRTYFPCLLMIALASAQHFSFPRYSLFEFAYVFLKLGRD